MTSKQSLHDHPEPLLQDRINWLSAHAQTAEGREREHIRAELKAARAEMKARGKKS